MQPIRKLFIWALFLSFLLLTEGFSADAMACDYYASPNGSGNGLSQSSPFRIAHFWKAASPGMTLCLLDGVYTGSDSMITPSGNLSGTSANPIRIRALNDGSARLDGQGVRRPVDLANNNDWFILEGFNVSNGTTNVVRITNGSDNNIVRRVVGWDADVDANTTLFSTNGGMNNVFEDVAGFGTTRKIFSASQSQYSNVRFRRAWGAWERSTRSDPKMVFTIGYNNYGGICENCIATWRDGVGSTNTSSRYGFFATDRQQGTDKCTNGKYLGSIGYRRNSDPLTSAYHGQMRNRQNCFLYEHVVTYDQGSVAKLASLIQSGAADGGHTPGTKLVNRVTMIGGAAPSIHNEWTVTNSVIVSSVAAAPNIWNGAGNQGARVCKRYLNGTLTDQPLWPWPMDARINAAITASGRNPADYFRGPGNTVTSEMEAIFGTIPAVCKGTSASVSQTPPTTPGATVPSTPGALVATPGG